MIWYSRHLSVSDWYTEGEIQVSQLSDQGRHGFIVFVPTEISLVELCGWINDSLEKSDLFHNMEIFGKYCRKRLENPFP